MKFQLTGKFGELSPVRNMQPHSGIDLAMPEGTTLRSVADGVVDRVFDGTGLIGKGLSIKFPDGTRAIYGHMNSVKPSVGDYISAGDIVGLSGNTGNSTGAHLHFSLKNADGSLIDPTPIADKLASISGDHVGPLGKIIAIGTESVREKAADMTTEIVLGIFDALKDFLLGATLIGSAVLIILKVAGWRDGGRWAGVLIVVNILLKFFFGGV
jgi:Peptidase family M23